MSLNFFRVQGGLLTDEFLQELAGPSRRDKPYGYETFGHKSEDAFLAHVAGAFDGLRARYRSVASELKQGRLDNGELRRRWLLPLFQALDFEPVYQQRHLRLGERSFAISHLGWPGPEGPPPPLHLVGSPPDLKPPKRGAKSAHDLLQSYLNHPQSPDWGVVSDGRVMRLLGQNFHPRPAFVEVDLIGLFEAGRELALAEFRVLYRLFHRSRFYEPLNDYYELARKIGTRDAEALRSGARKAIEELGNAFLNDDLKTLLRSPKEQQTYYQELLSLVYRLVFLLFAESRGLIPNRTAPLAERYREGLSVLALRELSENDDALEDRAADLFERLLLVFELVREGDQRLGIPALGGELFDVDRLAILTGGQRDPASRAALWNRLPHPSNGRLLRALRHLTHAERMRINYRDLGVEELGYIYEGLLGLVPRFDGERFYLVDDPSGRKASGSYYTPKQLVGAVVEESLAPLIQERLAGKETPQEKEAALLSIRVLDPAMGSGAFLTGALERLSEALAGVWVESGRYQGLAGALPEARHRVAERCLYGVDLNPMAVELAKLSIWIAAATSDRPLSFLDHHLKVGNSLVGAPPDFYRLGIPKDAYAKRKFKDPDAGFKDRPAVPKEALEGLKLLTGKSLERWRREHAQNGALFDFAARLPELPEAQETAADVEAAHRAYEAWQQSDPVRKWRAIADYWTAAWFAEPAPGVRLPDHRGLDGLVTQAPQANVAQLENSEHLVPQTKAQIDVLARRHRFFHWWLEFPEVFLDPSGQLKKDAGFDAVLGNPPWERVKLEDKQFFAGQDPEVAEASNKAEREKKIAALKDKNPALYRAYRQALADAAATSNFLHTSGRYPLTGRGDVNTYSVFAEHARHVLGPGRSGMLVPTGIATDDTNKHFFAEVVARGELAALLDFENREALFPDVHRSYKFSIFSLQKPGGPARPARLLFFATRVEHLADGRRAFTLTPADFALLNPNTKTCPTFRTKADAELTKAVYRRVPVLIREVPEQNPWGVRFLAMFHMSNDSHRFKTRAELEARGFTPCGNRFEKDGEVYLPLYEAKMIWQFDHRFATYDPGTDRTRDTRPEEHADPAYQPQPRYWVPAAEVEARLEQRDREGRLLWRWERGWLLGFRDITNSTNERTAIFSLVPRVGINHKTPLLLPHLPAFFTTALLGLLDSITFDYLARQKVAGTSLGFFILRQLPILPPSAYTPEDLRFLVPRVLELVYTAWDLAPFAKDVWEELSDPNVVPPDLAEGIRKELARRFAEH
uniref:Eco57I restriction-modification methylase domain-containing protein n=1 Tax=Oceanithermus sp. TaxID=2268145 RepID=UPI0025800633